MAFAEPITTAIISHLSSSILVISVRVVVFFSAILIRLSAFHRSGACSCRLAVAKTKKIKVL